MIQCFFYGTKLLAQQVEKRENRLSYARWISRPGKELEFD